MNKSLSTGLALALLASSATASAVELGSGFSLSGYVTPVSNYLFRGVTLSDDEFAGQAGLDLEHESGAYVGIWGSSYDNDGDTEYEIDWWGGYAFDINENISLDIGATRYYYADVGGHTTEFYLGSEIYGLGLTFFYDDTLESYYYQGEYGFDLMENVTLTTHAGYADPDEGDGAYDLGVTVGYTFNEHIEAFAGAVHHEDEDEAFVVGVNFSF